MGLHYHLAVPNTPESVRVAAAFGRRVAAAVGLHQAEVARAAKAAGLAVEYAVIFAYPDGRADLVTLDAWSEDAKFQVAVHDSGLPSLPGGDADDAKRTAFELKLETALESVDSHEWRLLGYGGKELTFTVSLPDDRQQVAVSRHVPQLAEPVEADRYEIRRLTPRDAAQVSRLVYRSYGHTYDDEDYYYPEKIVAENETGAMVSVVAVHPSGEVVGHYALEQREPESLYEGSSAVVNPEHRGRGLMERMREFATEEGRRLGLAGIYFLPWTIHTLSQKANEHFGAKLCAANLSDTSPVAIRGFESESLSQRASTLLYFTPLRPLEPLPVFIPERHREMVGRIYANLGRGITFEPWGFAPVEATSLSVSELPHDRFAEIRVLKIGDDFRDVLRRELMDLTLRRSCETVYLNLPLSSPGTPSATVRAEDLGFSFLGVGPCFAEDGDMLRMAFISVALDAEHIHVLSEFGKELVAYALAENMRVS